MKGLGMMARLMEVEALTTLERIFFMGISNRINFKAKLTSNNSRLPTKV